LLAAGRREVRSEKIFYIGHKLIHMMGSKTFIFLSQDIKISDVTSLYLLSRLLQVVDNKEILDSVASLVLYPHMALTSEPVSEADFDSSQIKLSSEHVNNIEQALDHSLNSQEPGKDKSAGNLLGNKLSARHVLSCHWNAQER